MAATIIENRMYFTINGQKYSLFGLVKDITTSTGTVSKHVQGMTQDGMPAGTITTNFAPTISWTESVPDAANYVKLISLLYSNLKPTIITQGFIVGEQTPSGNVTIFTDCVLNSQDINAAGEDTEMNRKITVLARTFTEV